MIFPNISLQDWLNTHNELEVETDTCECCGREMKTTIPFVEHDWVGLLAPECKCGESGGFYTQAPRTEKSKNFMKEAYYSLQTISE